MTDCKKSLSIKPPLFLYSGVFVGKETTGRAIARYHTESRRIEELHLSIAESDEERKTRPGQVTCWNVASSPNSTALRSRQALNLTENIAIERENLVKQLDSLK